MLKLFRKIRKKLVEHPSKGRKSDNIRQYLFHAVGEIMLAMIGIIRPVRDEIWVERNGSHHTHRAVRYGICINPDMSTNHMAYLTARSSFFAFYFLPICSPSGTGIIRRIESSLQMIKSKLNNNEPAYHATLKQ